MTFGEATAAVASEIKLAARRLARSRGFATLAIGTLAIGVGINTAMFALMDALLFRPPFHVADPAQVVRVLFQVQGPSESAVVERTNYPAFVDVKASGAFQTIAAYTSASVSVGHGRDAQLAEAMLVSREFFQVLRSRPQRGNFGLGDATVPEGGDQAVISYGFWQRHFGANARAIGAQVTIDERSYSVAGIAPKGLHTLSARPIDLWLPLDHASAMRSTPRDWKENRGSFWLAVVGRLAQGTNPSVTEQRASAVLWNRRAALGEPRLPTGVTTTSIVPGRNTNKPLEVKVSMWLAAVSTFVLLIACANVSNLALARMFGQRREYFVRLMLGASSWHLVRQVFFDLAVIVVPAMIGALGLSFLLRNGMAVFFSADIPVSRQAWDPRTTAILISSVALAFLLLCVICLAQLRSVTAADALLTRAVEARSVGKGTRRSLLALQAMLCLALLFIAGLFAKSLRRVESLDLGVDLNRTIQLTINLGSVELGATEIRAVYERARETLAQHSEVERVTLAEGSPYKSGTGAAPWSADRTPDELWADRSVASRSAVGPGFFATVGAQSLRGRDFTDSDRAGGQPVAIINAPLAKHLWPARDPLGECMWLDDPNVCIRVIGVLSGVWKFSALQRNRMAVYLPLAQVAGATPGAMFVRPRGDARKFLPQARSIVQTIRPDLPAVRAVIAHELVEPEFRPWRMGATAFSAFAAIALLMASVGLYGVVAVIASLRLREIGIRMSLGAPWPHVIRVVVGEGVASVLAGLVAGTALVLFVSRWLGGVLFETSPTDPEVLAQMVLLLLLVSAVALTAPTIRALRTNPARVLQSE